MDDNLKNKLDGLKKLLKEDNKPKEINYSKPKPRTRKERLQKDTPDEPASPVEINDEIEPTLLLDDITDMQARFLQAYLDSDFCIHDACVAVGISRKLYYTWMKQPNFKEAYENTREYLVDIAERTLAKLAKQMDGRTAQFISKTLGKKRGYTESIDITSNGETIQSTIINLLPPQKEDDEQTKGN